MSWMQYTFWGNTVQSYVVALAVFVAVWLILKVFRLVALKRLHDLAKRTKTEIDDIIIEFINGIGWSFYFLVSIAVALQFLATAQWLDKVIKYWLIIIVPFYLIRGFTRLIDFLAKKVVEKKKAEEADTTTVHLIGTALKIILWIIAVILILSNLGFNVSGLVAGIGIGGIAIAFALQNILTDIFASVSIYLDKPFKVGDFIIIGNDMGTVKRIGIKSTRIQTLQGQELVVSNKELTEARVHNYKKMEKRRIVFQFGVVYGTPTAKMKKIPGIVKKIIDKIDNADLDRVHFKGFGDFSLNFEVVYYVATRDYNVYMDIQQEINLGIKERFEKEKIEMAFPTQTIHLSK